MLRSKFTLPATPEPKNRYFATIELGGNGLTFEVRECDQYNQGAITPYFRNKITLDNSAQIRKTGIISDETINDIIGHLKVYASILNNLRLQGHEIVDIKALSTAPLRDAANRLDIKNRILNEVGFSFTIESEEQEAFYTAMGLLHFYPDASGLIVDVGGGSTEFILLKDGEISKTQSFKIGTSGKEPLNKLKQVFSRLDRAFLDAKTILPTGATYRNINKALATREELCMKNGEIHAVKIPQYHDFIATLTKMKRTAWNKQPEGLMRRKDNIPRVSVILNALLDVMNEPQEIGLTKTKTRDGVFVCMHIAAYLRTLDLKSTTSIFALNRAFAL